jgi:hypothetical protein
MPATFNDSKVLANDPSFRARVQAAAIPTCGSFFTEPNTTPYHHERIRFASKFIQNPDGYTKALASRVAIDTDVIEDATVGGTVILTNGNVASQQQRITDPHLSSALGTQINGYLSQKWWQHPRDLGSLFYSKTEMYAKVIKAFIQMLIGMGVLGVLFYRAWATLNAVYANYDLLLQEKTLEMVGKGLAYAAGVELVYMLFTEGLDEALDPPMMGIAAAILVVVSGTVDFRSGIATALLVAALAGLFATKRYLFTLKT